MKRPLWREPLLRLMAAALAGYVGLTVVVWCLLAGLASGQAIGADGQRWGDATVAFDGQAVTFCNALVFPPLPSDLVAILDHGGMTVTALIDQRSGLSPDLFSVIAPPGFMAWPVEILVREDECETIIIAPEGLS